MLERIADTSDARLAPYRELKDRHLRRGGDLFVAESELVVRRLLASCLKTRSVLAAPAKAEALAALRPDVDVLVLEPEAMRAIVGFPFHRGVLALGERPPNPQWPTAARRALVVEDVTDVDNMGSLMRVAAAFGVEAVLLSPRCADPYYRKALRTAIGTTFALTVRRAAHWPGEVSLLRERHALTLLAAVLDPTAVPLARYAEATPFALCVGSEGPGLSPELRAVCDRALTIPMAAGADSLNVAIAAAVILHHLTSGY